MRAPLHALVDMSRRYWDLSFATTTDETTAWERFRREATELGGLDAASIATAWWSGQWRSVGFPRVVIGPRRAAVLMATGVSAEQMPEVTPPWPAFFIELTDSPIAINLVAGGTAPIDRLAVHYTSQHHGSPAWTIIAETPAGPSIQRFNVLPKLWLDDKLEHEPVLDGYSSLEVDDVDRRALTSLSRLVASLCLSFSEPSYVEAARARAKGKSYRARRRGPPQVTDYVLGDDVRVDVREAVGAYVSRGGRAPTVQSLVRGHWKMQVHGEGRALRRWMHIEPYWRGPEDAPILVRRHRIIEDKP
jgi:hypothetical protein